MPYTPAGILTAGADTEDAGTAGWGRGAAFDPATAFTFGTGRPACFTGLDRAIAALAGVAACDTDGAEATTPATVAATVSSAVVRVRRLRHVR